MTPCFRVHIRRARGWPVSCNKQRVVDSNPSPNCEKRPCRRHVLRACPSPRRLRTPLRCLVCASTPDLDRHRNRWFTGVVKTSHLRAPARARTPRRRGGGSGWSRSSPPLRSRAACSVVRARRQRAAPRASSAIRSGARAGANSVTTRLGESAQPGTIWWTARKLSTPGRATKNGR